VVHIDIFMPFPGVRKQRGIFDVPDDFLSQFKESIENALVTRPVKAKKYLEVCEEIFGNPL